MALKVRNKTNCYLWVCYGKPASSPSRFQASFPKISCYFKVQLKIANKSNRDRLHKFAL